MLLVLFVPLRIFTLRIPPQKNALFFRVVRAVGGRVQTTILTIPPFSRCGFVVSAETWTIGQFTPFLAKLFNDRSYHLRTSVTKNGSKSDENGLWLFLGIWV
jgi:hypothetical protein